MKKLLKRRILFVFAFLFFILSSISFGELITIKLLAQVTEIYDGYALLTQTIHTGDLVTATYIYDSTAVGTPVAYLCAKDYAFHTSPFGIQVDINGKIFKSETTDPGFYIFIQNNWTEGDSYNIHTQNNVPLSDGRTLNSIDWGIRDSSGAVFNSLALLNAAPNLTQFDNSGVLKLSGEQLGVRGSEFHIYANVISAELIPEPTSFLLLSCGLWFVRRKSK